VYLQYGSFTHADSECGVSIRRDPLINEGGQFYALKERWEISGFLQADTSDKLTAAMNALEAGYVQQGQSIGLFFANGKPSFHGVIASNTLGGPLVVQRPTFQDWKGAEYTTYRSYSIIVEWELPIVPGVMLSFHETLTFEGTGGPKFGFLETLTGPPQKQLLAQSTVQRATQSGTSIGYLDYAPAMLPLFPAALHEEQSRVWKDSPKRVGPPGSPAYKEFPRHWNYVFEGFGFDTAASPNRWI
jgi:hypothetical protein